MNADNGIDLLRRTNYMRVDKASEIIAAQHCCGIHCHRYLVLEGVRCAALRNIGSLGFLDTYRTMCIAPSSDFRRVLEDVRELKLAA